MSKRPDWCPADVWEISENRAATCENVTKTIARAIMEERHRGEISSIQPCANCGKNRHTPLRRDDMGGYVCLQCVDARLNDLDAIIKRLAEALPYGR